MKSARQQVMRLLDLEKRGLRFLEEYCQVLRYLHLKLFLYASRAQAMLLRRFGGLLLGVISCKDGLQGALEGTLLRLYLIIFLRA